MVLEYLIKVLENHNQGPGELNQGPGVLGSRTRRTTFSEQNGLPRLDFLKNKKWSVEVMSEHLVLYFKANLPKQWTASLSKSKKLYPANLT